MTKRNIVKISEDLCNGCGLCVNSCAEGAIQLVNGKAKLVKDQYCDGLGACLGECPQGAITIEQREAESFDEKAVKKHLASLKGEPFSVECGCPGMAMKDFRDKISHVKNEKPSSSETDISAAVSSELRQWPVQLHLLSPSAPYFKKADVLLAADCTAFAFGGFHGQFLKNKSLAIACPKLDSNQEVYLEKLTSMIDDSQINTLSVMIMEVPCCMGLLKLAKTAVARAKRKIPIKEIVVGIQGDILSEDWA